MKDNRSLSQNLSAKKERILIIVIYIILLCTIILPCFLNTYPRLKYVSSHQTLYPLPNIEYLTENPNPRLFSMKYYRIQDIYISSKLIQVYMIPKFYSHIHTKKATMKIEISIIRSSIYHNFGGDVIKKKSMDVELVCTDTCLPQMIADTKISMKEGVHIVAIELLNAFDLYEKGLEAFTIGIITQDSSFYGLGAGLNILYLTLSICSCLLSCFIIKEAENYFSLRIITLCSFFVHVQTYTYYEDQSITILREITLAVHAALVMNLWLTCIEYLADKKYNKSKILIVITTALLAFLLHHLLWDLLLRPFVFLLGAWSLYMLISYHKKLGTLVWKDKTFIILCINYLLIYFYILTIGGFNFLEPDQTYILFYHINAFFMFTMTIIYLRMDKWAINSSASLSSSSLDSHEYNKVDVTVEDTSAMEN